MPETRIRRRNSRSKGVPDAFKHLFDMPAFAHLGTLRPDGRPQVTPVWVKFDGRHAQINAAAGWQKARNLIKDG